MSLRSRPGRAVAYALAAVAAAAGAGCGRDGDRADAPQEPARAGQPATPPRKIGPAEAAALIREAGDDLTLLDARSPEDFAAERVAGAIHLSAKLWPAKLERRLAAFDREGRYLVYCKLGAQCERLAESMSQLGFERVLYIAPGGLDDLKALGISTRRAAAEVTTAPAPSEAAR